jgi:hypothetical protein
LVVEPPGWQPLIEQWWTSACSQRTATEWDMLDAQSGASCECRSGHIPDQLSLV